MMMLLLTFVQLNPFALFVAVLWFHFSKDIFKYPIITIKISQFEHKIISIEF